MVKKFIIGFLASLILTLSVVPYFAAAHAQTWYHQPFKEWSIKVFDDGNPEEIFGERYTYAQVEWIIYSIVAFLVFSADDEVFSCLMENDGDIKSCPGEIIAAAADLLTLSETNDNLAENSNLFLAGFTTRPISGIAYFKDIADRAKLIPEVGAQGFGFSAANPVLGLWKMVRNITYFLLIFVIIIMSFMIMFRVKISPQTVISVQSALPKVIAALLLITFSYAIAGLLIDLMYVVIGLIAGILSSSGLVGETFGGTDYGEWLNMYNALTTGTTVFALMAKYFLTFVIGLLAALFSAGIDTLVAIVIFIVVVVVIMIVLIFAWIKILWLLLKTFAMILLQIIVGPIMILLGTFGQGGGFGLWLRGLVAHLAVYPAVGFMFVMSFVFLRGAFIQYDSWLLGYGDEIIDRLFPFGIQQTLSGSTWTPPLTVGSTGVEILWLIVSLATLLMIPNIANIIRGMIEKRPFAFGSAIGTAIGAGAGVAFYPVTQTAGLASEAFRRGFVQQMQEPIQKAWGKVGLSSKGRTK